LIWSKIHVACFSHREYKFAGLRPFSILNLEEGMRVRIPFPSILLPPAFFNTYDIRLLIFDF